MSAPHGRTSLARAPDVTVTLTMREAAAIHLAGEIVHDALKNQTDRPVLERALQALARALERNGGERDDEGGWVYRP